MIGLIALLVCAIVVAYSRQPSMPVDAWGTVAVVVLGSSTLAVLLGLRGSGKGGPGERKYRALFEESADAILIIDHGVFVDCNEATVHMLRAASRSEVLETHPSVLSPEFQPDGEPSYERANRMIALAFEKGNHRFEWMHKRLDGEVFPVEVLLTSVPDRKEHRTLHVVWRDITERKRIERENLQHVERLQLFNDAIMSLATDAELVAPPTVRAYQRITETMAATLSVMRASIWLLAEGDEALICSDLYEASRHRHSGGIRLTVQEYPQYEFAEAYLKPLGINSMLDVAIRIRGQVRGVVCAEQVGPCRPWSSEEVEFAHRLAEQVSNVLMAEERRQGEKALRESEERLQQSQKMEAVGQLAGGVAHDFNNLLLGIMGTAELLSLRCAEQPEAVKACDLILETAERAADLVSKLMDFSRKSDVASGVLDIHTVLGTTVELLERSIDRRIRIVQELHSTSPRVRGDKTQVQNALLNLGLNARDAMP
ncbi:MAG: PAS domain-containing sensor histidine kinase, partial [Planctomycetota bacterium]